MLDDAVGSGWCRILSIKGPRRSCWLLKNPTISPFSRIRCQEIPIYNGFLLQMCRTFIYDISYIYIIYFIYTYMSLCQYLYSTLLLKQKSRNSENLRHFSTIFGRPMFEIRSRPRHHHLHLHPRRRPAVAPC